MASRNLKITSNFCRNFLGINKLCTRKMSVDTNSVLLDTVNNIGIITLNRPRHLNVLNLSMAEKLYHTLKKWENEKTMVLVKGAGDKAFCAGGDTRSVYKSKQDAQKLGEELFRKAYTLIALVGTYKIPYIALIDGIVMGGGVGISVHGQYRVATEKTVFSMPETLIGHFPDVGATYFLPRLSGKLGFYLGISGNQMRGPDVLKSGIATHYCRSELIKDLESAILKCSNEQELKIVLKNFDEKDNQEFSLAPHMTEINHCFGASTVEETMKRLNDSGSDWAQKTKETLQKMSPTSMKLTHKALNLGTKMTLQECLQMEFRIAIGCLANKDIYEGIRALLVDKDFKPKWSPQNLGDVSDEMINKYFEKLPDAEELKHMR